MGLSAYTVALDRRVAEMEGWVVSRLTLMGTGGHVARAARSGPKVLAWLARHVDRAETAERAEDH